jgi:hypothetical protein
LRDVLASEKKKESQFRDICQIKLPIYFSCEAVFFIKSLLGASTSDMCHVYKFLFIELYKMFVSV